MEGKKVLWVVFSIALALVVILAAGLFLLRPRPPKSSEASGAAAPSLRGYDPYEYVRGTSAPPGLTPPTGPQPKVIVVGEPPAQEPAPQERAGEPPAQEPAQEPAPPERAGAPPERATATAAAPPLGRQSGLPQPPVAQRGPPPERAPPERAGAAAKPAAAQVRQPAQRVGTPRERVRTAARPKAVSVTEYWIQAGSFSSAARADEVSRRLEERGLTPRTTTRDLNGKTHFRVRVGPYTNKAEAEKFLGWIRELKGFETSYISMVASRRSMP